MVIQERDDNLALAIVPLARARISPCSQRARLVKFQPKPQPVPGKGSTDLLAEEPAPHLLNPGDLNMAGPWFTVP